jgi:hypothetical protein
MRQHVCSCRFLFSVYIVHLRYKVNDVPGHWGPSFTGTPSYPVILLHQNRKDLTFLCAKIYFYLVRGCSAVLENRWVPVEGFLFFSFGEWGLVLALNLGSMNAEHMSNHWPAPLTSPAGCFKNALNIQRKVTILSKLCYQIQIYLQKVNPFLPTDYSSFKTHLD